VKPTILLVGEYPPLLETRSELLSEWDVITTNAAGAPAAISKRAYHLMIFCQTVPDSVAEDLTAQATRFHPGIKVLALSCDGEPSRPHLTRFAPDIYKPALLREIVAALLSPGCRMVPCKSSSQ
jgi:hypothetical protein